MYFSQIKVGNNFFLADQPTVIYQRLPDGQNRVAVGFAKNTSTGETKTITKMTKVIPKSSDP